MFRKTLLRISLRKNGKCLVRRKGVRSPKLFQIFLVKQWCLKKKIVWIKTLFQRKDHKGVSYEKNLPNILKTWFLWVRSGSLPRLLSFRFSDQSLSLHMRDIYSCCPVFGFLCTLIAVDQPVLFGNEILYCRPRPVLLPESPRKCHQVISHSKG